MIKINLNEKIRIFLCYHKCVTEIFTDEIIKTKKK